MANPPLFTQGMNFLKMKSRLSRGTRSTATVSSSIAPSAGFCELNNGTKSSPNSGLFVGSPTARPHRVLQLRLFQARTHLRGQLPYLRLVQDVTVVSVDLLNLDPAGRVLAPPTLRVVQATQCFLARAKQNHAPGIDLRLIFQLGDRTSLAHRLDCRWKKKGVDPPPNSSSISSRSLLHVGQLLSGRKPKELS